MTKYIGITIGPIVKTLQNSKETFQLWGSSYIFSYIMKRIILKLNESYICEKIIIPYAEDLTDEHAEPPRAGLYPDRLIFRPKENLEFLDIKKELNEIIDEILTNISDEIYKLFNEGKELKNVSSKDILENLKNYIQIYYAEIDIKSNEKGSIILEMSPILDMLDLNEKIQPKYDNNYLLEFLKNKNIKNSFLIKDAFEKKKSYKIPDTNKIASYNDKNPKDKKYSNYFAIVYSDGDNISKIINNLSSEEDYIKFSKKLHEYAKSAITPVEEYGGLLIYAGGDDLMFFAPVANGKETIFDLIRELSSKFDGIFCDDKSGDGKPTLSFGMAIGYYKHPLYELRHEAQNQLFGNAKHFKLKTDKGCKEKNAISFKLIKHSGQAIEATFNEDTETYKSFLKLLNDYSELDNNSDNNESKSAKMLKSLTYKIKKDEVLITETLKRGKQNKQKNPLKYYFKNNFNEEIHKDYKNYIDKIQDLIEKAYDEYGTNNEMKAYIEYEPNNGREINYIDIVVASLKFLSFLNERPTESEIKMKNENEGVK